MHCVIDRYSGGVPLFWQHLKEQLRAPRFSEFVDQSSIFAPLPHLSSHRALLTITHTTTTLRHRSRARLGIGIV